VSAKSGDESQLQRAECYVSVLVGVLCWNDVLRIYREYEYYTEKYRHDCLLNMEQEKRGEEAVLSSQLTDPPFSRYSSALLYSPLL